MSEQKQELGPLQAEWIRCLKSGEFRQTQERLFSERPYRGVYANCCLGVACCVAEVNGIELPPTVLEDSTLPQSVIEAMHFRSDTGELRGAYFSEDCEDGPLTALSEMNDEGLSFKAIAEFVEQDPSQAFTAPA